MFQSVKIHLPVTLDHSRCSVSLGVTKTDTPIIIWSKNHLKNKVGCRLFQNAQGITVCVCVCVCVCVYVYVQCVCVCEWVCVCVCVCVWVCVCECVCVSVCVCGAVVREGNHWYRQSIQGTVIILEVSRCLDNRKGTSTRTCLRWCLRLRLRARVCARASAVNVTPQLARHKQRRPKDLIQFENEVNKSPRSISEPNLRSEFTLVAFMRPFSTVKWNATRRNLVNLVWDPD